MYWEKIDGMFTFSTLYSNMVINSNPNNIFVEIGAWKGKSAVYMAEEIKKHNKQIKFFTIDSFNGEGGDYDEDFDVKNQTVLSTYYKNIEPLKNYITTIVSDSKDAYNHFDDHSIDFLFIDGDHRYEGIKRDLQLWFPKIKYGGIIAGHDYNEPTCGVKQAVDEFFTFTAKPYMGGCWIYYN